MIGLALDHYSIRTTELEACRRFYGEILGLRDGPRPPFKFPGVWFYADDAAVVHIVGLDPQSPASTLEYLGERADGVARGSGTIDHVAFRATGLEPMRSRLAASGVAFRERTVPSLGLHQLFVEDPNGITVELNFPATEARP
jgi:catechol 2,3-dioxygenase-like lactoylglutathione lyase family enzyme